MKNVLLCLMTACLGWIHVANATNFPESFQSAKGKMWQVYKDNRFDQYCGCPLGKRNAPDLAACGYEPRKNAKRAARTEAEHVVPAENLGRQFACWRNGGREHCLKTDVKFREAHNDLHNLMPVIGEVNGDRSNFRFDEVPGNYTQYGQCPFKVDFATRRAEPPAKLKGDIARIHYYMRDTHRLKLSDAQERLFGAWNRMDPVDEWEKERDRRIGGLQGNRNPYVSGGAVNSSPDEPLGVRERPTLLPASQGRAASQLLDCSRKTCKVMASCEEARYKLNACGHGHLDRNGDGTPCESLCR